MRTTTSTWLVLAALTVLGQGCSDDKPEPVSKPDAEADDAGARDGESDAAEDAGPSCTKIPEHSAIINAGTGTEKVEKDPVLPLLKSDGTLPPLP